VERSLCAPRRVRTASNRIFHTPGVRGSSRPDPRLYRGRLAAPRQ